jgi:hypothetical protein
VEGICDPAHETRPLEIGLVWPSVPRLLELAIAVHERARSAHRFTNPIPGEATVDPAA